MPDRPHQANPVQLSAILVSAVADEAEEVPRLCQHRLDADVILGVEPEGENALQTRPWWVRFQYDVQAPASPVEAHDATSPDRPVALADHPADVSREGTFFSVNDLAEKLWCSDDSMYRALHAGRITATRVGRNWRISPAEVMRVLKDGL